MIREVGEIARVVNKLWLRETVRSTQSSNRQVGLVLLFAVVAAAGFGILVASISVSQLDNAIPDGLRTSVVRSANGTAIAMSGLVAAILCLTFPSNSSFQNLLNLLPISRVAALVGQIAPILAFGLTFSISLSSSSFVVVARVSKSYVGALWGISIVLLSLCVWMVFCVAFFFAMSALLLRIPYMNQTVATGAPAIAVIGISIYIAGLDVLSVGPVSSSSLSPAGFLITRAGAEIIINPSGSLSSWLIVCAWFALTVLLFILASTERMQSKSKARIIRFLAIQWPARGPWRAQLWFEILAQTRSTHFIATLAGSALGLLGVILVSKHDELWSILQVAVPMVPSIPALTGLYAVGCTLSSRWIQQMLLASERSWIAPKVVASMLICSLVSAILFATMLLLGFIEADQFVDSSGRMILGLSLALFAGSLIPFSVNQPVSNAAGAFLAGILFMAVGSLSVVLSLFSLQAFAAGIWMALSVLVFLGVYIVNTRPVAAVE